MPPSSSLIYGRHPVLTALEQQVPVDRILMHQTISGENIGDILRLARERQIPVIRVPQEKLHHLVKGNHQGVVAYGAVVSYIPLQDMISHLYESGKTPLLLLLDGITDVRNTGAIIRTAVCCGVDAILFPVKNAAPLHEDMIKTSAGALMHMQFCREKNLSGILETLQLNGIKIFSTDLKANKAMMHMDFRMPCCLVLGSEEKGISAQTRQHCDELFHIPMAGAFDSFNVSVAAGIICFEAMKQRLP